MLGGQTEKGKRKAGNRRAKTRGHFTLALTQPSIFPDVFKSCSHFQRRDHVAVYEHQVAR